MKVILVREGRHRGCWLQSHSDLDEFRLRTRRDQLGETKFWGLPMFVADDEVQWSLLLALIVVDQAVLWEPEYDAAPDRLQGRGGHRLQGRGGHRAYNFVFYPEMLT